MSTKKILSLHAAAAAFLLFLCVPAGAQVRESSEVAAEPEGKVPSAQEEEMPLEIDNFVRVMPKQDASHQSGGVGVVDATTELSYEVKAFGKLPVEFSFEHEYIGLNNSTAVGLPEHLVGLSTGIDVTVPFFGVDKTYLRLGASPSYYGDNWELRSSRFRVPSRLIGIYQPNDKWTFVAGVGVFPDFEDEILPILGFIYKPDDKWLFHITPDDPYVSYAVNKRVTLVAEGGITASEFEVEKDSFKNVRLKYSETRLGAGVKYRFNKHAEAKFSAGGVFGRTLEYDPDSLGKVVIKNSPYCEFRLSIVM